MNVKLWSAIIAMALFVTGLTITSWQHEQALTERLARAEQLLDQARASMNAMEREHGKTMAAASSALRAREDVYAEQSEKIREMEAALCKYPDFASVPVPDDLLRLCREKGSRPAPVSEAPAGAAGRH